MKKDSMIRYVVDAFLTGLFSTGICSSILLSLRIDVSFWVVLGVALSCYVFFSILFYRLWIPPTFMALALGSLWIASYYLPIQDWAATIPPYWGWLIRYITGQSPMLPDYILTFAISVSSVFTLCTFFLTHRRYWVMPHFLLAAAIFFTEWILGRRSILFPLLLTTFSLIILYGRAYYKSLGKESIHESEQGMWQLFSIPLALFIILMVKTYIPEDTQKWKWQFLDDTVQTINDHLSDYTSFRRPRTGFSLRSTGFQPLGDRLGGPVQLKGGKVLEVESPYRVYLRGSIYNEYTGSSWTDTTNSKRFRLDSPSWKQELREAFDLSLPDDTTLPKELYRQYVKDIEIRVNTLEKGSSVLFSPHRTYKINPQNIWKITPYFNNLGEAFSSRDVPADTAYTLKLYHIDMQAPSFDDFVQSILRNVPPEPNEKEMWVQKLYSRLPESYSPKVSQLAKAVTEGKESEFDKALALQEYLQRNSSYTLIPDPPPRDKDFVEHFLDSRTGYCTYYASAMAVMARAVGLPSRYVEGYRLPSQAKDEHTYTVTNREAHAWAEVYFRGIGWLPFDATPVIASGGITGSGSQDGPVYNPYEEYYRYLEELAKRQRDDYPELTDTRRGTSFPLLLLLLLPGTILLLLITASVVHRLRFSPSLINMRYNSPEEKGMFYYRDILKLLRLFHSPPEPGETPYSYAKRIDRWLVNPEGSMQQMAGIMVKMKFSRQKIKREEAESLGRFRKALDKNLRQSSGFFRYFWVRVLGMPPINRHTRSRRQNPKPDGLPYR